MQLGPTVTDSPTIGGVYLACRAWFIDPAEIHTIREVRRGTTRVRRGVSRSGTRQVSRDVEVVSLDELVITVDTTTSIQGCVRCGTRAVAHDRRPTDVRDLACFGRPVRLRVLKRRWRCPEPACDARTFTESHDQTLHPLNGWSLYETRGGSVESAF